MTKVIKNGTIVTADRSWKADVKIDGGKIVEIGANLSADETIDATGCYVKPGGIDPHTHLEMPFNGHLFHGWISKAGPARGLVGRHHHGDRFLPAIT